MRYQKRRRKYLKAVAKLILAGRKDSLVYLDESGFDRQAVRTFGYAPKGRRVHGLRSGQRRPRTSLIAARIKGRLVAPLLFEGTTNTELFNQWLRDMLVPQLTPGLTIVMDNAAFHHHTQTRALIEGAGCRLLYLPPYSPDLNPIEHDFANLKRRRSLSPQLTLDDIVKMYCNLRN